jgi:hypothetical protein
MNLFPAPRRADVGSFSSATSANLNMPDLLAAPKFLFPRCALMTRGGPVKSANSPRTIWNPRQQKASTTTRKNMPSSGWSQRRFHKWVFTEEIGNSAVFSSTVKKKQIPKNPSSLQKTNRHRKNICGRRKRILHCCKALPWSRDVRVTFLKEGTMLRTSTPRVNISIRNVWPKFETKQQALERRDTFVRQLQNGDHSAQQVADKLAECKGDCRCGSPICPMCVRELRRWFICETLVCVNELSSAEPSAFSNKIVRFSAIPREEEYREGKLGAADLLCLNERLQKRHERAGFPLVFAGVDVSLNEFSASDRCWQVHAYGVVVGLSRDQVRSALSDLYPADQREHTPRPRGSSTAQSRRLRYRMRSSRTSVGGRAIIIMPTTERPARFGWRARKSGSWPSGSINIGYVLRGCRQEGDRLVVNDHARAELLGQNRGRE